MSMDGLEGDGKPRLSFNTSAQHTFFSPSCLNSQVWNTKRPFQIPHQTASLDVDQVPSMQEAVIEEQLTVNLEFCHCPFSATN